jgi:hypothetical protein
MAARIFREGVASRNGVLALTVRISIPQANNQMDPMRLRLGDFRKSSRLHVINR